MPTVDPIKKLAKHKRWRDRNTIKLREYYRRIRREARERVIAHYGGACECCGESEFEFLAIDHIDGNGGQHRKQTHMSGADLGRWLERNGYPAGYRVLCHNCNCARGFYGFCPHEKIGTKD